jgi:hypothetical protein
MTPIARTVWSQIERPHRVGAGGGERPGEAAASSYCFSKTRTLFVGWPCALVPFTVTVIVLPS